MGRAIALAFAAKGANVVIHARRSMKDAKALAILIRNRGVKAWVVQADLSRPSEVGRLIRELRSLPIDVLVNNASIFKKTTLKTVDWRDWDEYFDLHIKAPFALARGLFHGRREGRVVNLVDSGLKNPDPDYLPYQVSKSALSFLTRGLAKALAPKILVTALSPGLVLPPEGLSLAAKKRLAKKGGGWGRPEYVAEALLDLVTSKKSGIERNV